MDSLAQGKEILDAMLGHLGFVAQIDASLERSGPRLHVLTAQADFLTGRDGERLDEIQYLVNRLLRSMDENAPRVRVDVEHFRTMREDALIEEAQQLADTVKRNRRPAKMRPLNSYFRRIVHNAFIDDPDIMSWSPPDSARIKRITLMPRRSREKGRGPDGNA